MTLAAVVAALPSSAANAAAPARPSSACAPAPATAQFGANTNHAGVIDLHFRNAPAGSTVAYYECIGTRAVPLATRAGQPEALTSLMSATVWKCGRLEREFAAILTLANGVPAARGTSSVRTPTCARRFTLSAPRRIGQGQLARVRVVDRWGIGGIQTRLCVTSPEAERRCRAVRFSAAADVATRRFRLRSRGRWRVELRVREHSVRAGIAVGVRTGRAPRPLPTVLATGDSTMQGVDVYLSDDLADEATVIGDVRPGFGMSQDDGWRAVATSQAARLRPTATVVSIGAAEGYAMKAADGVMHACCDEPWIAEYTRRARRTMRAYRRNGRAKVLWMTLPAPRDPRGAVIFAAVNEGIMRAATGLDGVQVLRMDLLFTPNGYRDVMRYRGRDVRVREPDGVHLNISGAAIAAREVARAVRAATRR